MMATIEFIYRGDLISANIYVSTMEKISERSVLAAASERILCPSGTRPPSLKT